MVQTKEILLSAPVLRGREWEYVKECLDTAWISTAGSFVNRFEDAVCALTGAKHAVACVNGTAALHIALILADVKPGDEVIVPTVTFIATVNAVHYVGAHPVFMDCDGFYNMDAGKTIRFIEQETMLKDGVCVNKSTGRRIKAIIPVHVFGSAADISSLKKLCDKSMIMMIEDATESLGTHYTDGELKGRHTGTIGAVGCYSFNGNKLISCGGGGMIVTDDQNLADRARYLTTQAKDDGVRFIHHEVGYNYRLTNIQAALGLAQIEQIGDFIAAKKHNYGLYCRQFESVPGFRLASTPQYADNNHWLYALQIEHAAEGAVDKWVEKCRQQGIQTRPLWYLNHLQKPNRSCQTFCIEKAMELWLSTITLPCSVDLREDQIARIVEVFRRG